MQRKMITLGLEKPNYDKRVRDIKCHIRSPSITFDVLGHNASGTSSLISRYVSDDFPGPPTRINAQVNLTIDILGDSFSLELTERLVDDPLRKTHTLGADVIIIVADSTSPTFPQQVKEQYNIARTHYLSTKIVLVANKCDLPDCITEKNFFDLANSLSVAGAFMVSAKTGMNVNATFQEIANIAWEELQRRNAVNAPAYDYAPLIVNVEKEIAKLQEKLLSFFKGFYDNKATLTEKINGLQELITLLKTYPKVHVAQIIVSIEKKHAILKNDKGTFSTGLKDFLYSSSIRCYKCLTDSETSKQNPLTIINQKRKFIRELAGNSSSFFYKLPRELIGEVTDYATSDLLESAANYNSLYLRAENS